VPLFCVLAILFWGADHNPSGLSALRGMVSSRTLRLVVLGCLLTACEGVIGGAPSSDEPVVEAPVGLGAACDPDAAPAADLIRVHRGVYLEALGELLPASAVESAEASLRSLPRTQSGRFIAETEVASFDVVNAYVDIASTVAFAVSEGPALSELSVCLSELQSPPSATDEACLDAFIDDFGMRVFRRPVHPDEHTQVREAYDIGASTSASEGVATMLMALLLEPQFLYYLELEGEEVEPGVAALTSHEIAARLARALWGSIPDQTLLDAASLGFDGDEGHARLQAEVDRMWDDPRSVTSIGQFYRDWLALDTNPDADALVRFAAHATLEEEGGMDALFLGRTAFIEDDALAETYGFEAGTRGEVLLDAERRAGLLTRAAWLRTTPVPDSNAGHVIHRGAALSEVLCMPVPPPPPDAFPPDDPAEPTGGRQTIRQRFADVTQEAQCSSCHVRLDNFGGAFGHYGSSGEWIDQEEVEFDGEHYAMPIDASAVVAFGEEESVGLNGAVQLSEAAARSEYVAACVGAQLTENFYARPVGGGDACLIQAARDELHAGRASLRQAFVALIRNPAFSLRSLPESP